MVLTMFKMIANSGFLTALECTKFVSAGALPGIPLGELTASLRSPTSNGEGRRKVRGERKGRERGDQPPYANPWIRL